MAASQNPDETLVIRDIAPSVTTFSVPFLRFGRIKFGGRATVVRLQTGTLAVFSPVALTPSVQAKLSSLGSTVSHIAAPDIEHHIHLSTWANAFPSAHIIGMEGLPEKRAEMNKTDKKVTILDFGTIFTKKAKDEAVKGEGKGTKIGGDFDAEFEYEYVDGHMNKELVFFHKPSRTLIEADLMFNLPATEQYSKTGEDATSGLLTKLFGALQNTKGTAIWQKRLLWYAISKGDREGFSKSVKKINTWGFENIVPCHGDTIIGDGKGIFQKVFSWHLEGKK